jgi:uncharacterized protein with PIN domain
MGEARFVADCMLGRLGKWLRILGYDTLYDPHLDDDAIARLARADGRILLSRDTTLVKRKGVHSLFIESELLERQLAQVLRTCGLRTSSPFSRCPVCNSPLESVPRTNAWGQVPPFVFATQESFHLCPACNRFYWRGTHWQRMLEQVEKLRGQA